MLEPVETSEGYIRLPRVLFTDEQYKALSNDAKILYGLLLDRLQLSIKNGWKDAEGHVFIRYKVKEIQKALNCGHDKTISLLKALESEDIALIKRVHQGNGQTDRIYVREFLLVGRQPPIPPSTSPRKPSSSGQHTGSENQTSESKTDESGASTEVCTSEPSIPTISDIPHAGPSFSPPFQQEVTAVGNAEPVRSDSPNCTDNILPFPPSFQPGNLEVCYSDSEIPANHQKADITGRENRPAGTDFRPAGLDFRPYSYKDSIYPEFNNTPPLPTVFPRQQTCSPQREGAEDIRNTVMKQIDYDILCERFPEDAHYLHLIVSIVTDLLRSRKPTLRVNQEGLPAEDVREHLRQLRFEHIEYTLLVLEQNKNIGTLRGYLPTVLYNATAPGALEAYYDNRVKCDLEQEWEAEKPAYAI